MSEAEYSELIEYVKGDRLPYLERTIPTGNGIPGDLTGATVTWRMEAFSTGELVTDAPGTILDPTGTPRAHYQLTAQDALLPAARYRGRFRCTTTGGLVFSVPRSGYVDVMIYQDVGAAGAAVATVDVAPASIDGDVGEEITLVVTPRDALGNALVGRTALFESDDTDVATVSVGGVVTLVGVGSTSIDVSVEGVHAAPVTVVAASSTPTAEEALATFRAAVGDANLLGIYNAETITPVSGGVDTWADWRGASGFGPTLAPHVAGDRPPLNGTPGTVSAEVEFNGTDGGLTSGASAALGVLGTQAKAVMWLGDWGHTATTNFFGLALTTPSVSDAHLAFVGTGNSPAWRSSLYTNPGLVRHESSPRPQFYRRRKLWGFAKSGTTLTQRSYPQGDRTESATAMSGSENTSLYIEDSAGVDFNIRLLCVLNRVPTDADWLAFATLCANANVGGIRGYNKICVLEGDSITEAGGVASDATWAAHMEADAAMATWEVVIPAISGTAIFNAGGETHIADRGPMVDAILDTPGTHTKKVLVIWAGTNDIALFGQNGTTTHNLLKTYCQARQAAGYYVIVVNMLPRSSFFGGGVDQTFVNTNRATFNGLIAAEWATYADDYIDMVAAVPALADSTTADYADGTHPAASAQNAIQAVIQARVLAA